MMCVPRQGCWGSVILAGLLAVVAEGALAGEDVADICLDMIAEVAERRFDVPAGLLLAIGLTESGREIDSRLAPWPWALNIDGAGHFPDTRAEALEKAEAAIAEGAGNVDLGCMQISQTWHAWAFETLDDMLEPEQNVTYAADLLVGLHDEFGSWSGAVAAYHSRNPVRGAAYAARVYARWTALRTLDDILIDAPDFEGIDALAEEYAQLRVVEQMDEEFFLEVLVSRHYRSGLTFVAVDADGLPFISPDAFDGVPFHEGFRLPLVVYGDALLVDVAAIRPRPSWRIDPEEDLIEVFLAGPLFAANAAPLSDSMRFSQLSERGTGAHLNYTLGLTSQGLSDVGASLYLGAVVYAGNTTFRTDFAVASNSPPRRLSTTLYFHDSDRFREWQLGDTILRGGSRFGGSRAVLGITYASSYEMDPEFLRYQTYSVYDVADLPVVVEIFDDGEVISQTSLPPGPMALENLPVADSHGNLDVVITDVLGNQTVVSIPYVRIPRLMAPDTSEFSWSAGLSRLSGSSTFGDYGGVQAGGYYRYAVSPTVTREFVLQGGEDRLFAAVSQDQAILSHSLLAGLGLAVSRSARGTGASVNLSLAQLRQRDRLFGAVSISYATRGYGATAGDIGPVAGNRWTVRWNPNLRRIGFPLAVSYGYEDRWSGQTAHMLGTSYTVMLPGSWQLNLGAQGVWGSEGNDLRGRATLSRPFANGRRLASTSLTVSERRAMLFASLAQYPSEEGLGYLIGVYTRPGEETASGVDASLTSNHPWGTVTARVGYDQGGEVSGGVSISGSIGWFEGEVFRARSLGAPYAFIRTGEAVDLPLFLNFNRIAETNSDGWAIIDGLNYRQINRIYFPREALDFDLVIADKAESVEVVPALEGGYLFSLG